MIDLNDSYTIINIEIAKDIIAEITDAFIKLEHLFDTNDQSMLHESVHKYAVIMFKERMCATEDYAEQIVSAAEASLQNEK